MELKKVEGVYVAFFKGHDGKTHQRSTKVCNLEDAKEIVRKSKLKEIEMAALANALTSESLQAIMADKRCTLALAIEEWGKWREKNTEPNTIHSQRSMLNQWLRLIGGEKWVVTRITADHIEAFVNAPDEASKSTRVLRLAAIRSLFKLCTARCYCVKDPSREVEVRKRLLTHAQKEPKKREPITAGQYLHIIANTDGFWKWATALAYWTGLRLSDVCNLEWACLASPDEIIVHTQKTDARIAVPLNEPLIGGGELRSILLEITMEAAGDALFCFPEQRKIINSPDKRHALSMQYTRLLSSVGIEHRSYHCLRHSCATRMKRAGKTLAEIGRVLGHTNTKTTAGYAH